MSAIEVDLALVGAGGAGSAVMIALERVWRERTGSSERAAGAGPGGLSSPPRIVVVDPVLHTAQDQDRTWSLWHEGPHDLDNIAHRVWQLAEVTTREGVRSVLDLAPFRYVMIRSGDVYAQAHLAARSLGARWITAPVSRLTPTAHDVGFRAGEQAVRARWVLDSRPAPPSRSATVTWVQHFLGWTVRLPRPVVDPHVPVIMDLSVEQPGREVAFGYVLPLDPYRALVEFTAFSPQRLAPWEERRYEESLRALLARRWRVGPEEVVVEGVERGRLPMTDAHFARRAGRRVVRVGTAGGAARGSTGYAFAAMYRQARQIAEAALDGQAPVPRVAYPRRHRMLDGVLLTALDRGLVDGASFFGTLWTAQPPGRVLRFLDGSSSLAEELRIMTAAPRGPMTRATVRWMMRSCGRIVTPRDRAVAERH